MKKAYLLIAILTLFLTACSQSSAPETMKAEEVADTEEVVIENPIEDYELSGSLSDVTGGNASGFAAATFAGDTYKLYAEFQDLPELEDGYFYEGWVVRNSPLSVISTGATTNEDGLEINVFESDEDLSDHLFYVLTLEPDDGDPAPAAHVLEGTME